MSPCALKRGLTRIWIPGQIHTPGRHQDELVGKVTLCSPPFPGRPVAQGVMAAGPPFPGGFLVASHTKPAA